MQTPVALFIGVWFIAQVNDAAFIGRVPDSSWRIYGARWEVE